MIRVTVDGEQREYPDGTLLREIAEEYQDRYDSRILLAMADGKLRELSKRPWEGAAISFLTGRDRPGIETYRRSAVLLFMKAFRDVEGPGAPCHATVEFTLGKGLFIRLKEGYSATEELAGRIEAQMRELAARAIPIEKRNIHTDEAVELFRRNGMPDKEKLFYYRRVSRVNVYRLEDYEDYYYGYMVPDTGYLTCFGLFAYENGFVLMLPDPSQPNQVPAFKADRRKLFKLMEESDEWGKKLRVGCVGELNDQITKGSCRDLILIQEAVQEKKIAEIAAAIAASPDKKFIMIAGPSSSGKTTFARRLSIQLTAQGLTPHAVSVDDYFVDREHTPRDADGNYNFEALECIDLEKFNGDMNRLLAGERVELPRFNFKTGKREYKGDFLTMGPHDILVIEGIHCLNDRMSVGLPAQNKYKIYISALTQLNVDEHNRIPTTDGRLLRRIVRDARTRGNSAQETIRMWPSVRRGEEENIFPYQEEADVMFNSSLVYELAVLKQYAEPLLFSVPRDSGEALEARRLLKFLDYFLGVDSGGVPGNSLIREFIGGSCFNV